jgi:hypothetical protein
LFDKRYVFFLKKAYLKHCRRYTGAHSALLKKIV